MTAINREEWLKALSEAGMPSDSDDQALTVAEFAKMLGTKRTTAHARLQRLVTAGKAVQTRKRCVRSDGDVIMTTAYRLV